MTFRELQLQDILDVQWGDTKTTKSSYVPTGYLAYSASGPDGFLDRFDYDREGIVLSAIGANCGTTFFATGKWSCIKNTIRIFPKSESIDLKYFYYMTKAPDFWPIRGSAQSFISQTDIRELYVQLPELGIQRFIGNLLYELEQKINVNKAVSSTLQEITQALFKSWFIDFDPVKAKMAGERCEGLDEVTASLFPDSMEETELGLIPKGWEIGFLGKIADLQGGYAFKSSSWVESGVPVIKIGSVKPGFVDLTQVSYVTEELAADIPEDYRVPPGSLVVGLTGYVGQVGLVRTNTPTPFINQRVAKFKSKDGSWKIPFIYCIARNPNFKKTVEELATGTAQQNVSIAQILSIPVVFPSKYLRTHFDDSLTPLFQKMVTLADENELLISIRDSLLPRLISGELQIPEEMLAS